MRSRLTLFLVGCSCLLALIFSSTASSNISVAEMCQEVEHELLSAAEAGTITFTEAHEMVHRCYDLRYPEQ